LRHVEKYGERARPLVIRETYKAASEFFDNLDSLFARAYPKGVKSNRTDMTFRLPNGAIVELGAVADANSYKRYMGRSFSALFLEEYGLIVNRKYVELLKSNLRAQDGIPLRTIATANPGGHQHLYLYKNFIAAQVPWLPFEVEGETWVTCPGTFKDNPHIDGVDYERRLRQATAHDSALRDAWIHGLWSAPKGAMFGEVFDEKVHVLPTQWPFPVTKAWRPFCALDWGISSPSVCLLLLKAPGDVGPFVRNSLIVLDEVNSAHPDDENMGMEWPPSKLCEAVREMCGKWNVPAEGCGDDARGLQGETLFEVFQEHGCYFHKAIRHRQQGWAAILQYLHNAKTGEGPGLYFTQRAAYTLKTLPFLQRDPARPEDIVTVGVPDHGADALRFGILEHLATTGAGSKQPLGRYKHLHPLSGYTDPRNPYKPEPSYADPMMGLRTR
jgi:hypothetical protein